MPDQINDVTGRTHEFEDDASEGVKGGIEPERAWRCTLKKKEKHWRVVPKPA